MATSLEAALGGPEVLLVACEVDEGNQLEGGHLGQMFSAVPWLL